MKYFAVTQEYGPAWDRSRPMREQEGWTSHAALMDKLVDEGFIVLGGRLGDGSTVLLVFNADTEDAIKTRLVRSWSHRARAFATIKRSGKVRSGKVRLGVCPALFSRMYRLGGPPGRAEEDAAQVKELT